MGIMKASELRIGNYVTQDEEFIQGIVGNTIVRFELGQIKLEPIHLTEKWLGKFGFEPEYKVDNGGTCEGFTSYQAGNGNTGMQQVLCDDDFTKFFFVRGTYPSYTPSEFEYHTVKVEYVHQLQNLYFAITGEELEING
jgi:hypothetical protein